MIYSRAKCESTQMMSEDFRRCVEWCCAVDAMGFISTVLSSAKFAEYIYRWTRGHNSIYDTTNLGTTLQAPAAGQEGKFLGQWRDKDFWDTQF